MCTGAMSLCYCSCCDCLQIAEHVAGLISYLVPKYLDRKAVYVVLGGVEGTCSSTYTFQFLLVEVAELYCK
jgi:hypothetical protein